LDEVRTTQEEVRKYIGAVRAVERTLALEEGDRAQRQHQFESLQQQFSSEAEPVYQQMAKVMASFQPGLFVVGLKADIAQDNLALERWFRLPKAHERHIHGHRHAGVRIVQEGATLAPALDAHLRHPKPFTQAELAPYRRAMPPPSQRQAIARRKTMRKARSRKQRPVLLAQLESLYLNSS
jgi:hypothetical protein